jgi:hypothetical protein
MNTKTVTSFSLLLASCLLLPSCSTRYDRVSFNPVGGKPATRKPVPDIVIDTNESTATWGGLIKSNKPYDIIALYYMDKAPVVASVEFTKVTVTYADGTTDPGTAALKLPMRFNHFIYEYTDRKPDGSVVKAKSRRIEAEIPRTINRDEPFTLLIEGRFIKDDGTTIPFRIRRKYNLERDQHSESWIDYLSNC